MFYAWCEGSSGEQLFSKFDNEEAAQTFATANEAKVLARGDFNADEQLVLDWAFANANSVYGFDTSFDMHEDKKEIKHLNVNTRRLKHFKLCAFSDSY